MLAASKNRMGMPHFGKRLVFIPDFLTFLTPVKTLAAIKMLFVSHLSSIRNLLAITHLRRRFAPMMVSNERCNTTAGWFASGGGRSLHARFHADLELHRSGQHSFFRHDRTLAHCHGQVVASGGADLLRPHFICAYALAGAAIGTIVATALAAFHGATLFPRVSADDVRDYRDSCVSDSVADGATGISFSATRNWWNCFELRADDESHFHAAAAFSDVVASLRIPALLRASGAVSDGQALE